LEKGFLAERIADYALGLKFADLPRSVVHEARKRVVDSFACMLGGMESPPARAAIGASPGVSRGLSATVLGTKLRTTPEHAAFANGVLVRYLDFNDTYLSKEPSHPSDNIAAALSAAEASGAGGADFITALVAGYEVQTRLCDAARLRDRGWDHVAYGAFSATTAAAMLLGLERNEFVNALNIAGTISPALRQSRAGELSMWKGCAFANTSKDALFAAIMAQNGITGPAPVFEGEFGFERVVSGPLALSPKFGGEGGEPFKISDSSLKLYPAEHHSQSAIAAAIELVPEIEDIREIESVRVSTFGAGYEIIGSGPEKWLPTTREAADHSLPFLVSAALIEGNVNLATYSEGINDPGLKVLMQKVSVVKDPGLDRLYPEAVPNRVEVRLSSGKTLASEVIYPRGHPKNPMTEKELEDKFRYLSGWYLGDGLAEKVLSGLWDIDRAERMAEAMSLLIR